MKEFKSNEEFFLFFNDFIERLDKQGYVGAAQELRNGFACLNGLTDGWALLLDSINTTINENFEKFDKIELFELREIGKVVSKIVRRR